MGSTQTAMLGMDFLLPNRAVLDYDQGTLQLWDTVIPLLNGKSFDCWDVPYALPPLLQECPQLKQKVVDILADIPVVAYLIYKVQEDQ